LPMAYPPDLWLNGLNARKTTCIDSHKGIAHESPDMTGVEGF